MLIAYAPVVVFWDEIDLLLGRSTDYNGDSGASNEVRQAILTLLQDAADLDIFVIASSNNPLSAMQHRVRNRFHLIPVLHPAATTRSLSRGSRRPSSTSPSPTTRPNCSSAAATCCGTAGTSHG